MNIRTSSVTSSHIPPIHAHTRARAHTYTFNHIPYHLAPLNQYNNIVIEMALNYLTFMTVQTIF